MQLVQYPKSVIFLVIYQFFERSAFLGIGILLPIYMLNFSHIANTEDDSIAYAHLFYMLSFLTPILGGFISDNYLGIYKTVVTFSFVNFLGATMLFLTSLSFLSSFIVPSTIGALFLIAIGSGCARPGMQTLGGDQFKIPEQEQERTDFFSHLYFSMNLGIIIGFAISPVLRDDVHCFGNESCYPLALGFQAIFMLFALLTFIGGTKFYIYVPKLETTTFGEYFSCIKVAIKQKFSNKSPGARDHWLDFAEPFFDLQKISDIKVVLGVLLLHIPLPLYWALFFQQVTRWLFQGTRMDGLVMGFEIKPDQFQIMNPLLTVCLVPVCDRIVYPILGKFGLLKKPLQKITTGLMLATLAFLVCGLLEFAIENNLINHMSPDYKRISILWQFPQFFIMSLSEIMVFAPLMDFAYKEAPVTLKSLLQGVQLVTLGLGHLIVVIIAKGNFFDNQSLEFFLYSVLNFVNALLFMWFAIRYKSSQAYRDMEPIENEQEKNEKTVSDGKDIENKV